jgi:hypothetical protein
VKLSRSLLVVPMSTSCCACVPPTTCAQPRFLELRRYAYPYTHVFSLWWLPEWLFETLALFACETQLGTTFQQRVRQGNAD